MRSRQDNSVGRSIRSVLRGNKRGFKIGSKSKKQMFSNFARNLWHNTLTMTALWVSMLTTLSFVIPGLIVNPFHQQDVALKQLYENSGKLNEGEAALIIPVYVSEEKTVEEVPLEQYVRGVVAAEMPIEFELEALKAQAIASRTYIIRRLLKNDRSQVPNVEAIVTNTEQHQVYLTEKQMRAKWGWSEYRSNVDKLNQAVSETQGLILTYQGEPIQATFFSTSYGFTENSEDYWQDAIPYLRSVPSPWDEKLSPRYKQLKSIPIAEIYRKLDISEISAAALHWKVLERTESGRVKALSIGGRTFSGREIREHLGLASTWFQWAMDGSEVVFTTHGYGHGVGMSQWGANGMAKEGRTAKEILSYYYKDVRIDSISQLSSAIGLKS